MERKLWTYQEARKILPIVKEITEKYYSYVSELAVQLRDKILPENEMENKEEEIRKLILEWSSKIQEFGIEVKGLWLIDFDNGNGYYCWHLGEEDLLYEHGYEEGFAGRKQIDKDQKDGEHQ
ncbi:DUF2203 domain-containing protein [Leptospira interrogans]|uniref:PF09969 family protein n=16 Tax=Leptospira interrogans TaxID=173 RepID=Q8F813_LEPIN|nr:MULTISPECIES: DUF2203 domain-containing protein [Leptospira]APH42621.1 Uncharacterized protein A9P81_3069 [Leptospira interrogans serovar Copenhageni/Icterohaemorrhagiae]EMF42319.1 PF09969 family protein [Leptospira interrogans serovar Lora str. TE 1992]EMG12436.1 PF09969 family protein [Leptospira interrogans serovar Grippotyphosa str. LT2186]EMG23670.1 PF09969 family protein [Leptospira interrogans serovar Copenhageni str. LT2050]EMM79406.1 PF09969 family protein [Leptospira interrogans s